jgi:hypothetical protein
MSTETGVMVNETSTASDKLTSFQRVMSERRKGGPWHDIAVPLEEALSEASTIGLGEDTIRRMAEEASGLSRATLGRYISAVRKLKAAARAAALPAASLLSPGFNAVEGALRLYERSAAQGLETLQALAAGRTGLSEVQKAVSDDFASAEETYGDRSRLLRRRGLELQAIESALVGHFSNDSFVQRRPTLHCFRGPGWEVRGPDGRCLCGIGGVALTTPQLAAKMEMEDLPGSAILSTYFPQYFLAFSPMSPRRAAEKAARLLELFRMDWYGVMLVGSDHSLETLRPSVGPPMPDRTAEYEAMRAELIVRDRGG